LGSLISRLDCACYCAGLPSIGLAADKPFPRAWGGNRERGRAWDFPIPKMRQRSQAHRWSDGDFEALKCETRGLAILKGRDAWEHEIAKHESRVKAWAEIEAAS
jgi:hypothetical protein